MSFADTLKEIVLGTYSYTTKTGQQFFLHEKDGRGGTKLYYFSKKPEAAISLPPGFEVVESSHGLPLLKKTEK